MSIIETIFLVKFEITLVTEISTNLGIEAELNNRQIAKSAYAVVTNM